MLPTARHIASSTYYSTAVYGDRTVVGVRHGEPGSSANGNLTYDPSRRISHIAYNDAGRPQSVTFSSGDRIRYVYSASGRKVAERQLSADGLSDRTRRWVGGYEISVDGNGGLSAVGDRRLLLPQGYVDIKAYVNLDGTPVYSLHLYVADVQGNVVGVYDCSARALEQFTDYYPYGAPHPDATGADRQRRKFGGKELLSELGLDEYDFDARRLLSAVSSFSQPDPLAGIYPWISPYAYCAADPVNLIDPTGMIIDTSHLTKEDFGLYNNMVESLCETSQLFKALYDYLSQSKNVYYINFTRGVIYDGSNKVSSKVCFNESGGDIAYGVVGEGSESAVSTNDFIEELFHALQNENSGIYESGLNNKEFEAKTFILCVTRGRGFVNKGMEEFNQKFACGFYDDEMLDQLNPRLFESTTFLQDYFHFSRVFTAAFKNDIIDPTPSQMEYLKPCTVLPANIKFIFSLCH